MNKEKAELVVKGIDAIARAQATIAVNRFVESTDNAVSNTVIFEKFKRDLVEVLSV